MLRLGSAAGNPCSRQCARKLGRRRPLPHLSASPAASEKDDPYSILAQLGCNCGRCDRWGRTEQYPAPRKTCAASNRAHNRHAFRSLAMGRPAMARLGLSVSPIGGLVPFGLGEPHHHWETSAHQGVVVGSPRVVHHRPISRQEGDLEQVSAQIALMEPTKELSETLRRHQVAIVRHDEPSCTSEDSHRKEIGPQIINPTKQSMSST